MGIPLMQNARADPKGMYFDIFAKSQPVASTLPVCQWTTTGLAWTNRSGGQTLSDIRNSGYSARFCNWLRPMVVDVCLNSVRQRNSGHDCQEGPGCWDVSGSAYHGTPWRSQSKPCGFEIGARNPVYPSEIPFSILVLGNHFQVTKRQSNVAMENPPWTIFRLPSGNLTELLKMTIEIVDFPIEHGDFPYFFVCLPEGICYFPLNGDDAWRLLPSFAIGRPQRAAAAANLPTTYRAAGLNASYGGGLSQFKCGV